MFSASNIKDTLVVELDRAKLVAVTQVNYERDVAIASGVTYQGETYQSDNQSIQDLTALATLSTIDPNITAPWLTESNSTVVLSAADIQALALEFATHKTTQVLLARDRKDAILAATTLEGVALALNG